MIQRPSADARARREILPSAQPGNPYFGGSSSDGRHIQDPGQRGGRRQGRPVSRQSTLRRADRSRGQRSDRRGPAQRRQPDSTGRRFFRRRPDLEHLSQQAHPAATPDRSDRAASCGSARCRRSFNRSSAPRTSIVCSRSTAISARRSIHSTSAPATPGNAIRGHAARIPMPRETGKTRWRLACWRKAPSTARGVVPAATALLERMVP